MLNNHKTVKEVEEDILHLTVAINYLDESVPEEKIVKDKFMKVTKRLLKHWKNIREKVETSKIEYEEREEYPGRLPHYYDPTPQTEQEKQELLKLIG